MMYSHTTTNRSHRAKKLLRTEVWGGNWRVDQTVALPGLDAWIYSEPCNHSAAGGDVHYVSTCASGQFVRILVADVSGHGLAAADTADALRRLMQRVVNDHDQQQLIRRPSRVPIRHRGRTYL
jgi:hypothetical protein